MKSRIYWGKGIDNKLWGISVEKGSNGTVISSYKGELIITKMHGYICVHGEVRLGRWDGREPTTDQEFDFTKFRSVYPSPGRFSEIRELSTGLIEKQFAGRGFLSDARHWAWQHLSLVPITVPFDIAKARDTGEGERDWQKLLTVLAQELKFMKANREPDIAVFETMATNALNWDRKSPLSNEDDLRSLYNERILKSG